MEGSNIIFLTKCYFHVFNKYILSTYRVPNAVLDTLVRVDRSHPPVPMPFSPGTSLPGAAGGTFSLCITQNLKEVCPR